MKKIFALSVCCLFTSLACFSQLQTKSLYQGNWTEKDNGISVLKWTFNYNGFFNQISFWNNPTEAGGTFSNGKFYFDDKTNVLHLNYEKYALVRNESLESNTSNKILEWKIKSISENEIVINRPANKELEKQLKSYDGKNVDIILTRNVMIPY